MNELVVFLARPRRRCGLWTLNRPDEDFPLLMREHGQFTGFRVYLFLVELQNVDIGYLQMTSKNVIVSQC